MSIQTVAAMAIVALVTSPGTLSQQLPAGNVAPYPGATCHHSVSALGTSNTYGSGKQTTVVNIWEITKAGSDTSYGWIVKSFDGHLWYEDPIGWEYREIRPADEWLFRRFKFDGCFTHDLIKF